MNKMMLKRHALALGLFTLIAALMTIPVLTGLQDSVVGTGGDPWQVLWRFEHKQELLTTAIQEGSVGSFVYNEFLGGGAPALVNLSVWPWMPLHALFGQPVTYNLIWLLSFILAGHGMYMLVHYLAHGSSMGSQISLGALIAGLVYAFLPYHVAHSLGHFGAFQIQWLPYIVLLSLYWFNRPTTGKTIGLGLLLAVQAWTEHHYMLWLGILFLVTLIVRWKHVREKVLAHRDIFGKQGALLVLLLFVGVVLPYMPTIRLASLSENPLDLGVEQTIRFSADAFSYVVPSPFHPVWGSFFRSQFSDSFTGNISESTLYLGIVSMLLVLFFHQPIPKPQKTYWGIIFVVFVILSLGPKLHVFGHVTAIPLPYALIDNLPAVSSVRAVARAGVMVGLSLSVLVGLLLTKQLHRQGSAVALAAVLLVDVLFLPVAMQAADLSPAYEVVADMEGKTVLEIPAATNYTIASRALYATRIHGKEVLGSIALERAADIEDQDISKILPGIRQLLYLRTTELREGRPEFLEQDLVDSLLDTMVWMDTTSILVHKDSLSLLQFSAVDRFLETAEFSRQDFEDVYVYSLPENRRGDGVFAMRGDGWEHIGFDSDRDAVFAEVPDVARMTLINTSTVERAVQLVVPTAPESQSGAAVLYDGEEVLEGGSIVLSPGENTIEIKTTGEGRAIIMNPKLIVEPI